MGSEGYQHLHPGSQFWSSGILWMQHAPLPYRGNHCEGEPRPQLRTAALAAKQYRSHGFAGGPRPQLRTAALAAKQYRSHGCAGGPRPQLRTAALAAKRYRSHGCAEQQPAATAAASAATAEGAAVAFRHSSNLRHEEKCVKTKCISSKNNLMICLQRLRMGRGNDCEGALRPRLRSAAASSNQSAEQQPSGVN